MGQGGRHDMMAVMKIKRAGFTLVEVMIVVAILAMLAGIAIPNVLRGRLNANDTVAKTTLKSIGVALEEYLIDNDAYPSDMNLLLTPTPPYLRVDYFDGVAHSGFTFAATTLTDYSYSVTAAPLSANQGSGSFTITTGGVLTAN